MLTVKAKHATMLLMVSEVDGLSDGLEELEDEEEEMPKHPPAHPSVVMVSDLHTYTWLWGSLGALSCVCLCILCHELSFFLVLSVDNHPMGLLFLPQGFLRRRKQDKGVSRRLLYQHCLSSEHFWAGLPRVASVRVASRLPVRAGFRIKSGVQFGSSSSCMEFKLSVLTDLQGKEG